MSSDSGAATAVGDAASVVNIHGYIGYTSIVGQSSSVVAAVVKAHMRSW